MSRFDRVLLDDRVEANDRNRAAEELTESTDAAMRGTERASQRSDGIAIHCVTVSKANERRDARVVQIASDFAQGSGLLADWRRRSERNSPAASDKNPRCSSRSGSLRPWL